MILEQLTVNNFRVFEGEHALELAPRVKYGRKRPIILFGGLNGAGKTTTLNAVRLALYGKHSLGTGVPTKAYEEYLSKSIHRSNGGIIQPNSASVELAFSYATLGQLKHYVVKRSWERKSRGVRETLTIKEDGQLHSELNYDQCQGLLNELVPIGVSDLFFFDGERIAELADDTTGETLGDAIKKLLGLDLIEILIEDLSNILRSSSKTGGAAARQKRIEEMEEVLLAFEVQAANELEQFEHVKPQQLEAEKAIAALESSLSSRGGTWAASREDAIRHQSKLTEEKRFLENSLRDAYAHSFPLLLAPEFVRTTIDQLRAESDHKRAVHVSDIVQDRVANIKNRLQKLLPEGSIRKIDQIIDSEFDSLVNNISPVQIIHDVSDRLFAQIEAIVRDAKNTQKETIHLLASRLTEVNESLDRAGTAIARAPEEARLKPILDQISKAQQLRANSIAQQKQHLENHKRFLREALSITRQLEKTSQDSLSNEEMARITRYAESAIELLRDFSGEMAKRKVKDLESEFAESFHRLARKEDIDLHASIDPSTFAVTLLRSDGVEVDKDELSAGEKQIYAISVLDALSRTSGRHLPIIIDTPLGRLDSVHRDKLVNRYFPHASHQVIILSTDTEVDESFYADLSADISHAFKLDYQANQGCTVATEGYFWREQNRKAG